MALVASGCVIAGPPDYQDPQQTPPVLDLSSASPGLDAVIPVYTSGPNGPTSLPISVDERSEDAGDGLVGLLYLDYGNTANRVLQSGQWTWKKPEPFEQKKTVQFTWSAANQPLGCHSLTLLVTHAANVDGSTGIPVVNLPKDRLYDIAFATWWLDIIADPNSTDSTTLSSCPKPSP